MWLLLLAAGVAQGHRKFTTAISHNDSVIFEQHANNSQHALFDIKQCSKFNTNISVYPKF